MNQIGTLYKVFVQESSKYPTCPFNASHFYAFYKWHLQNNTFKGATLVVKRVGIEKL